MHENPFNYKHKRLVSWHYIRYKLERSVTVRTMKYLSKQRTTDHHTSSGCIEILWVPTRKRLCKRTILVIDCRITRAGHDAGV